MRVCEWKRKKDIPVCMLLCVCIIYSCSKPQASNWKGNITRLFSIQCAVTKNRHVLMLLYLELRRLCGLWSMYRE